MFTRIYVRRGLSVILSPSPPEPTKPRTRIHTAPLCLSPSYHLYAPITQIHRPAVSGTTISLFVLTREIYRPAFIQINPVKHLYTYPRMHARPHACMHARTHARTHARIHIQSHMHSVHLFKHLYVYMSCVFVRECFCVTACMRALFHACSQLECVREKASERGRGKGRGREGEGERESARERAAT